MWCWIDIVSVGLEGEGEGIMQCYANGPLLSIVGRERIKMSTDIANLTETCYYYFFKISINRW